MVGKSNSWVTSKMIDWEEPTARSLPQKKVHPFPKCPNTPAGVGNLVVLSLRDSS